MLGANEKVSFNKSGNTLKIIAPQLTPINNPSEFAWVFKVEGAL
jgi:alpha-L-fucosidase